MASRKQDFPKEEAELRAELDDPEAWDALLWLAGLEADWARLQRPNLRSERNYSLGHSSRENFP